ncbi:HNH endonuclease [Streptomyces sp. NPDC056508]|uniref:HNH endonuclease n=1 Tax=Streptomyces sp. NPDC056508 TaxID=3345845 RepID=UPI0036C981B4
MATSHALTCQYEPCGKTFEAARKRKYCEPLCERRAYSKKRQADGRRKAYQERTKAQRAAYAAANAERFKVERECLACGRTWRTARRDAKYCSFLCRDLMRPGLKATPVPDGHPARRGPACAVPERHPARQSIPKPRRWVMGECRRCSAPFVVADNRRQAAYCSARCCRRDAEDKRRAMESAAFVAHVNRTDIFERDGWICMLCRRPVNRLAAASADDAPSIDHVVPLARGGTHEPANVQCAHVLCNAIKSDREWLPEMAPPLAA